MVHIHITPGSCTVQYKYMDMLYKHMDSWKYVHRVYSLDQLSQNSFCLHKSQQIYGNSMCIAVKEMKGNSYELQTHKQKKYPKTKAIIAKPKSQTNSNLVSPQWWRLTSKDTMSKNWK